MNTKIRIIITIFISVLELIICKNCNFCELFMFEKVWLTDFISMLTPAGILYLLNYYIFAPVIFYTFQIVGIAMRNYRILDNKYEKLINQSINWLLRCKKHWGVDENAEILQNANTCEGLLALRKSKKYKEKNETYKNAINVVLNNTTNEGLPSKSLNKPTVVCTSMILDIVAQEREESSGVVIDYEKFELIAENMWNNRSNVGWGVYIKKGNDTECSFANTYWALRALNKYRIGKTKDYKEYLKLIYEYNNNGKFGFQKGDISRLTTTAMYLCLYYSLEECNKKDIGASYNRKKAIEYIYKSFIKDDVQIEKETIWGIKDDNIPGAIKAPWTHITIGYVIEALSMAHKNNDIGKIKFCIILNRINQIVKENVTYVNDECCFYMPNNMERSNYSCFTFPTTCFVQGLSSVKFV